MSCLLRTACLCLVPFLLAADEPPKPIRILFLGDSGHHKPAERFKQLQPEFTKRGINLTYTDNVADLNARTLGAYDGLMIYANTTRIAPEQEAALLDYVASGKGFIPVHCASFCFLNSPKYIELVGAQFQRHGTGIFRTTVADGEHPVAKGYRGFESWDETYVHTKHNDKDRTILEFRIEGDQKEPWTWVRTHGKGRVFYTAWGHDERTWSNPGFLNLIERGTRWACGFDPAVAPDYSDRLEYTPKRTDVKPFEYVDADIPFYPPNRRERGSGEPLRQMQRPVDAAESMKHFVTPVGFEVQLFASDPEIGKPLTMNWDERGRLLLVETIDYPNEKQREGEGRDRIRILEDTNGDGRADKFTTFAEKLSIPTSLISCRGGIIVHQAPHTLYLKDTDGDGKADLLQVLFTGWKTDDTHAGPSNLRYGLDNWYYGQVGYAGFEGEIAGERRSFRTGFYRFRVGRARTAEGKTDPHRVAVTDFEFLRNTSNNSWGVGFSEEGILFGSTANGNPSVYLPIPNRFYESVRGWSSSVLGTIAESNRFEPITEKVRQVDWHGGFTAAAGHALYTARNYPREYWNRTAFVAEPTGHLVATFTIQGQGADFRSKNSWNLIASDDEWSAPTLAEVGPDGNVWIIDWYNYIVQHNPTPSGFRTGKGNAYETDLRDKKHGRVYRIAYKTQETHSPGFASSRQSLEHATNEQLVAALTDDNMFWRLHAQRLLVEQGKSDRPVIEGLLKLLRNESADELGLNPGATHAVWTLHGTGALDGSHKSVTLAVQKALNHPAAGVRRNAVQVLPRRDESLRAIIDSAIIEESDPQTRLAALLALTEMPLSLDASLTLTALKHIDERPNVQTAGRQLAELLTVRSDTLDRWLLDAATSAAAHFDAEVLVYLAASKLPLRDNSVGERISLVAAHHARGAPRDTIGGMLPILLQAHPSVAEAIVAGLERGWPKDKPPVLEAAQENALVALFEKLPSSGRGRVISLASRWGSKKLAEFGAQLAATFLVQLQDAKLTDRERLAAAAGLIEFRRTDASAAAELLQLITPRSSVEFATGLLEAAGQSESPAAGDAILQSLTSVTPTVRPVALRLLLTRTDWTRKLIAAAENGDIQLAELSLDQKQALAAHTDRELAARARKLLSQGGGLPNPDRQKVVEELLPLLKQSGDVALGKEMYKKHCAKCHVHGTEGTRIGPDLTGMAVHPKEELLTHIIDPSRSVEGNFRMYAVATTDGKTLSGLLASETRTALELFDTEGKKHSILREEIDQLVASTKSLMPEGFEKQMTPAELVNLLEFLTQRGKYVPLDLRKVASAVSTRGMFVSANAQAERLIFSDWTPKTFQGVPFQLVDPQGDKTPNAILFYSTNGYLPPKMPKSVTLPCNMPARAIHFLSGVSGWGFPYGEKDSVSLIVRLHYASGSTEDHPLKNGEHFADYIRRVEVPGSTFAFASRGQQIRYLSVHPQRNEPIREIELVKGPDNTAPVVMAVTVESATD
jgi:uncharacterized protein